MSIAKITKAVRISVLVLISIAGYAGVSPVIKTEAREAFLSPDSLIFGRSEQLLPPVLTSSNFDGPGEFRFITPIASNPHDMNADFDADLLPYLTVKICKVDGPDCSYLKEFTSTTSPDRLRIENKQGKFFIVNWTTDSSFDNTPVYRVSVEVPGETLGSVDLPPSAYRQWGRTWPIKFIVEKDPELRIRLLAAAGLSLWEIADILRAELGLCDDELSTYLLSTYPNAAAEEVEMVVSGVCQIVEIPRTTKVADAATRNALSFYDPATGRMGFTSETSVLKQLNVNDVLVSKPSAAAPYGYLRKVTAIRKERGAYFLESVQAKMYEAITRGTLQSAGTLLPSGGAASTARKSALTSSKAGAFTKTLDEGDQLTVDQRIDVTFNLEDEEEEDDDVNGTGTVRVTGQVFIKAGYNIGAGIEPCLGLPPVCVDRLEAWMGFEQKSNLRVVGNFKGNIKKEETIYPVPMQPIIFFIGPIPVVLVPQMNVIIGIEGKAEIDFEFAAVSDVTMKPYIKWTEDNGWQDLSQIDDPIEKTFLDADITGTIEAEAYAKLDASLLLYGVVGPSMDGSLGIGGKAQFGASPLWRIFGHAEVGIGLRSSITELFGVDSPREAILDAEFDIAEAQNEKPRCSARDGVIPVDIDSRVFLGPSGNGIGGYFNCTDPDGDSLQIEYTPQSSNPADLFSNMWTRFLTADQRTVTITAKDQDGETEQVVLTFKPQNSLPVISPYAATNTVGVGVQYFINALVYDWEERDYLRCNGFNGVGGVNFSVQAPNTSNQFGGEFNCSAEVVFASPGPHTILITAVDKNNGYSEQLVTVNVTAAPSNAAPVIDRSSINFSAVARTEVVRSGDSSILFCPPGSICSLPNGESIDIPGQTLFDYILPFHLSFDAADPGGQALTKKWYCRWVGTRAVTAEMNQNPDGSFGCGQAPPGTPIFVWGTVSDGTTDIYTDMRTYILGSGLT